MNRYLSCTYRTPKHFVEFYQTSIKEKGKEIEINFTDRELDLTYYDIDFFEGLSEKNDNYVMNDENNATK